MVNITIMDTPFSLNCPPDITLNTNAADCSAFVNWTAPQGFCTTQITSSSNSGDLFPLGTTIVTYTAIDDQLDTTDCSFSVTVVHDLAVEIDSLLHPACLDTPNGQAFIHISGGSAPYTFDWNYDGAGDHDDLEDQAGLMAGMNQVTITDHFGCTITDAIELFPTSLNIVNCPADQRIRANVADCSAIATWAEPVEICSGLPLLATFASGDTFNLGTTLVTYSVTNVLGETATCSFEVQVENDLEIVSDQLIDPSCVESEDGQIAISVNGGSVPYQIDWDTDGVGDFDDPEDLGGLAEGTYIVEILDAVGCSKWDTMTLQQPDTLELDATVSIQEITDERFIDLNITGGMPPYRFDWNTDEVGDYDDPEDIRVFAEGTYSISVMDEMECIASLEIVVEIPATACDDRRFKVYPNPSFGVFNIELEACETPSLIEIFDVLGRKIYSREVQDDLQELELENYAGSTYFLKVSSEKASFVRPIILVKE